MISFKNKWVRFHREKTQSPTNNRVLLFKPLSFFLVLLFPLFLYLNESAGLKSISGFVLLLLNVVILIILVVDLLSDMGKKNFNFTTLFYFLIFSFLVCYIGAKILPLM